MDGQELLSRCVVASKKQDVESHKSVIQKIRVTSKVILGTITSISMCLIIQFPSRQGLLLRGYVVTPMAIELGSYIMYEHFF